VTNAAAEFAAIRELHPSATLHTEGGNPVVLLPDVRFTAAGSSVQMSLLLYPSSHSGYVTRLFFEQGLAGAGQSTPFSAEGGGRPLGKTCYPSCRG
jgi:hypothetical protein